MPTPLQYRGFGGGMQEHEILKNAKDRIWQHCCRDDAEHLKNMQKTVDDDRDMYYNSQG